MNAIFNMTGLDPEGKLKLAQELQVWMLERMLDLGAKPAEEELRKLQKDSYDFGGREARRALEALL